MYDLIMARLVPMSVRGVGSCPASPSRTTRPLHYVFLLIWTAICAEKLSAFNISPTRRSACQPASLKMRLDKYFCSAVPCSKTFSESSTILRCRFVLEERFADHGALTVRCDQHIVFLAASVGKMHLYPVTPVLEAVYRKPKSVFSILSGRIGQYSAQVAAHDFKLAREALFA